METGLKIDLALLSKHGSHSSKKLSSMIARRFFPGPIPACRSIVIAPCIIRIALPLLSNMMRARHQSGASAIAHGQPCCTPDKIAEGCHCELIKMSLSSLLLKTIYACPHIILISITGKITTLTGTSHPHLSFCVTFKLCYALCVIWIEFSDLSYLNWAGIASLETPAFLS